MTYYAEDKDVIKMENIIAGAFLPHPPIMTAEIGRGEEEKVRKTINATRQIAEYIVQRKAETIVVISPHGPLFRNAVGIAQSPRLCGSFAHFGAPEVAFDFANDLALTKRIATQCEKRGVPYVEIGEETALRYRLTTELDHGALVPLYYLREAGFKGAIVHLSVGFLEYRQMERFGEAVQEAIRFGVQKIAVIASGDLSHRLDEKGRDYSPCGKVFDERVLAALAEKNVQLLYGIDEALIDAAGQCGLRSLFFLFGVLKNITVKTELISYEAPFGVGYAVAVYKPLLNAKGGVK